jgi:hypothetical protein
MLHPLLAGAIGGGLAAAVFLARGAPWVPLALLLALTAVQWRYRASPAEAALARRWLVPPTIGLYAGAAVYFFTGSPDAAGAGGCAVVAAIWLVLYARERLRRRREQARGYRRTDGDRPG